jgi:hypothetical protein
MTTHRPYRMFTQSPFHLPATIMATEQHAQTDTTDA